jgi:hypothetical protein
MVSESPNVLFRKKWLAIQSEAEERGIFRAEHEAVFYLGAQVVIESILEGGGPGSPPEYVINRMILVMEELVRYQKSKAAEKDRSREEFEQEIFRRIAKIIGGPEGGS